MWKIEEIMGKIKGIMGKTKGNIHFYIILFLCLGLLAIFLFIEIENGNNKKLYNGSEWKSYRLADFIMFPFTYWFGYSKNNYGEKECIVTKYYDLLGLNDDNYKQYDESKYEVNLDTLSKIVDSYQLKNEKYYDDTLFIHLRIGDVVKNRGHSSLVCEMGQLA